jgi:hypothetical protein
MKGLEKHIPYILARTLTNTAVGAEMAVRATLPGKFTLRNTFTEKGIRFKAAQKNAAIVQAEVFTDTANRRSGAPDYLGRQETGGEKCPVNGRMHIAIPMPALWQLIGGKGRPIPAEMRPRTLLSGYVGQRYADFRYKKNKYTGERERQLLLRPVKLVRGWIFFLQPKDNPRWIMGRKADGNERDIHPMYKLVGAVTVPPRLDMIPTVQSFVDAHFVEEWEKMWLAAAAKGIRI